MPDFTILLPPARDKQSGGNPFAPDMFDYRSSNTFNFFSSLNPARRELIEALQETLAEADESELAELFGLENGDVEEAAEINEQILNSPLMSALDRYSPGTLYKAMDFANLPTGAQRRMLENGLIFSGLFGLLRPDDLIPNYILSYHAKVPEIGVVSDFWRPRISPVLNDALEGQFVWDFLDETSHGVWEDDHTYDKLVRVRFFREDESGERQPVTEGAEELEGQLIGFIVDDAADTVEALNDWDHPEHFQVDPEASSWDDDEKVHEVVMIPMEKEEPEEMEEE